MTENDYRLCPVCQNSVLYDEMIWLNGECTCPACYLKKREELKAKNDTESKED